MAGGKIVVNPKILAGKPIIKGTRIAVETVMDMLAAGMSSSEIIQQYPFLTRKDIQVAISFAASRVKNEELHLITKKNGEFIFANS